MLCSDTDSLVDTRPRRSTLILCKSLVEAAGLLWSVTPKLVWFLFLYAGVGTYMTTSAFGKRLMQLHFATVQREGDLRFSMVRTRENAGTLTALSGAAHRHPCAHLPVVMSALTLVLVRHVRTGENASMIQLSGLHRGIRRIEAGLMSCFLALTPCCASAHCTHTGLDYVTCLPAPCHRYRTL